MTPRLSHILIAAGLALGLLGALVFGVDSCRRGQGAVQETQSAIHQGEANAHVQQANVIPTHETELAAAKTDVDRARAEVARLRKLLAAKPSVSVPDPVGGDSPDLPPAPPDHRDEVIAAQDVLITKLDGQVLTLEVALRDEQARSKQFREAFEAERKATAAQQAATEAWKKAVTAAEWKGGIKGAIAGAALAYLGGRR